MKQEVVNKVGIFIVGEPKSGTTALSGFLSQHPNISMPSHKEPHFFCTDHIKESDDFHGKQLYFHVRTEDQYHKLFPTNKDIRGEASTGYLYSKDAAKNIHKYNPNAKIIIMLRNPVDFIHSLHMQYVNESTEDITDFKSALAAEKQRKKNWNTFSKNVRCPSYLYYSERVTYAKQIKRFLDLFDKKQILILTNEEFKKDNSATFAKVLEFLGLDKNFTPSFSIIHGSKAPRNQTINHLLHNPKLKTILYKLLGSSLYTRLHKRINRLILKDEQRDKMPLELRKKLYKEYTHEIRKLNKLLKRDFSLIWKE